MANLQLVNQSELECDFVIDDILEEDKEIVIDPNDPDIQFTKFLYAIRHIEKEMDKFKDYADRMALEINDWLERKLASKQNQIDFMTNLMRKYLYQNNLKSLSLLPGSIGFRKQPDKIEIVDADAFFTNATFDLIRVVPEKFEPDMAGIKARINEKGEIPAGVDIISQESKFYYKLKK